MIYIRDDGDGYLRIIYIWLRHLLFLADQLFCHHLMIEGLGIPTLNQSILRFEAVIDVVVVRLQIHPLVPIQI